MVSYEQTGRQKVYEHTNVLILIVMDNGLLLHYMWRRPIQSRS